MRRWIKKVRIKNHTRYYFDDISKKEDFDINNVLRDEKTHENISILWCIYIVIWKLVKTKTNSKHLIGYLDEAIRPFSW